MKTLKKETNAPLGTIKVNVLEIKMWGLREALILAAIRAVRESEDEEVRLTTEALYNLTGLTAVKQRQAIKHLSDEKLLFCEMKGLPAKMYYTIMETEYEGEVEV